MRKNVFTSEFYNTKKIKMLAMKKDYFIKVLNPNKHVLKQKRRISHFWCGYASL